MSIPFAAWLFQGIPECIAMAAVVFSLGTERLQWRTIALVGIFQAISLYLIRLLPISFYFHVIIGVVTLAYFCAKFGQLEIELSSIYSLLALFWLLIFEFGFMFLSDQLQIITYEQFLSDVSMRILLGLPQVTALFLVALLISRSKYKGLINFLDITRSKKGIFKRNIVSFGELK